jgi:flagellar biosynthesis protein FlhA
VQQLLDGLAKTARKLVEGLIPETMPLSTAVRVMQNLLAENVPVRDLRTIVETLAEFGGRSQDADVLTAFVRTALGRAIVQRIVGTEEELPVITLDPALEQMLQESLSSMADGSAGLEPGMTQRLQDGLQQSYQRQEASGQPTVLLVAQPIRMWLSQFMKRLLPDLSVLAYNEIPDDRKIRIVSTVGN